LELESVGTKAVVIGVDKGLYRVMHEQAIIACRLRGRLARAVQKSDAAPVVIGDEVLIETLPDGTGVIGEVLPRRSTVVRKAAGSIPRPQLLAANVDLAGLVVSLKEPRFKPGTAIQFALGARAGGVEPLVILNKVDLGDQAEADEALEPLRAAGIRCLAASATEGDGLEELAVCLRGSWTLFFGQSGVGKSSLLNRLCPEAAARTADVSHVTGRGRHTTTGSTLYALPEGGFVIDTPGVRSFSFWDAPQHDSVGAMFPEIEELARHCRFSDCAHLREPGCAVLEALALGEIDSGRYRHFVRLAGRGRKQVRRRR
jgi:ribosome biogenesis GTPase